MSRPLAAPALLLVLHLLLPGRGTESTPGNPVPKLPVRASFSEDSGLVVTDGKGTTQQLIPASLAVRAEISGSGRWIVVEDMQLSNLVVVRAFYFGGERYQEVSLPGIRSTWKALAGKAGIAYEDLENPRLGIEGFAPGETHVELQFRADTGLQDHPELIARVAVPLEAPPPR